jgi:hypothetical protein
VTRTLCTSAVLAAIFCRVDGYPWNFASLLVVAVMSAAIALVWRDEKRARQRAGATSRWQWRGRQ